jgi:hypothetical protein
MSKIIDGHTLDYTTEELEYFETKMRKFRLPKYVQFWKKVGVPFIRFTFLPALIIIVVFGAIYMNTPFGKNDWMWTLDKAIALTYIAGYGLWTLSSHIVERVSTNKLRKRLGLTKQDFQILVIAFQITGTD